MPNEEYISEQGPEAEDAYGPDDGYAESSDEAYVGAGDDAYPVEPESQEQDSQTPLIAGGIVIAALVAVTCCLLVVAAVWYFQGSGGGEPVPTLPPIHLPTNTPAAPAPDSPTPTPGDDIQPTPTTAAGPGAVINAPAQANTGERVSFDGSQSQPGTSPIARYDWDFGDGNKGSGAVVRYVYRTAGDYMVTLTVTDQDGLTDTAPAQITIVSPATDQPTAPPEPTTTPEPTAPPEPTTTPVPAPVIDSFEVVPEDIQLGQCVKVSWSTSGGTFWVNLVRDDDFIWEGAPLSGSMQDCPDKTGDHRYRIVAWNEVDDRIREDQMVTVTE